MSEIDPGGTGGGGGRPKVELAFEDRVARVTLNDPPLNVLTLAMVREISAAILAVSREPSACAIVFESAPGTRAFSAGIALDEHRSEIAYQMLEAFHGVFRDLNFYSKPTIAVVTDAALGAGCELAAFCDFVIAGERARFGLPEIKTGVFPPLAATILPRLIGLRRAKHMILTGALLSASEALEYGLVTYVVPDEQVPAKLAELTGSLRKLSAPVLEVARRAVTESQGLPVEDGLARAENLYLNQLMALQDPIEGLAAFAEKRAPVWKHK